MMVSDVDDAATVICLVDIALTQARSSGQTLTAKATLLHMMTLLALRGYLTALRSVTQVSEGHMGTVD